jgi:hypothetical protein
MSPADDATRLKKDLRSWRVHAVVVTPDRGGGPVVAIHDGAQLAAGKNAAAQTNRFLGIEGVFVG